MALSHRTRVESPRRSSQLVAERARREPGRKRACKATGPDHAHVTGTEQGSKRHDARQPLVHVTGVALDDEIDVLALVVLAHSHAIAVDVEPGLRATNTGEDDV